MLNVEMNTGFSKFVSDTNNHVTSCKKINNCKQFTAIFEIEEGIIRE